MLKKLMSYEFRATGRYFLPLYAVLLALAAVNRLFFSLNFEYVEIPQVILTLGMVALIVGVSVMTLIVTIQRFYKNLLTDEGYLSFTLPVKPSTHINCKLLVSLIWDFVSVIVILLSVFVLFVDGELLAALFSSETYQMFVKLFEGQTGSKVILIVLFLLLLVVASLYFTLKIYSAISIGSRSSKHKIVLGVCLYFGFSICEEVLLSIVILCTTALFRQNPGWIQFFADNGLLATQLVLLALLVYYALMGIVYYTVTHHILSKHLNLE